MSETIELNADRAKWRRQARWDAVIVPSTFLAGVLLVIKLFFDHS